jgi:hypothetical protein
LLTIGQAALEEILEDLSHLTGKPSSAAPFRPSH